MVINSDNNIFWQVYKQPEHSFIASEKQKNGQFERPFDKCLTNWTYS